MHVPRVRLGQYRTLSPALATLVLELFKLAFAKLLAAAHSTSSSLRVVMMELFFGVPEPLLSFKFGESLHEGVQLAVSSTGGPVRLQLLQSAAQERLASLVKNSGRQVALVLALHWQGSLPRSFNLIVFCSLRFKRIPCAFRP